MKNLKKNYILSLLVSTVLVLTSCDAAKMAEEAINNLSPPSAAESAFCGSTTVYSPGVVVSGTAKFRRRGLNLTINSGVVTSATTGAVISTLLPIKYAEIKISDSNGNIVQCGTTNQLGELKAMDAVSPLFLPSSPGNFTVEVFARSNFTFPSAGKPVSATLSSAVKEDIYSNSVYKISGTLSSNGFGMGPNSPINLIAQAQESISNKIEGGAFNIYNNWVTTFEYLLDTNNTGNLDVSCLNERLDLYWKAGFNPALYIDPNIDPSNTISFYLREDQEIYICGGVQGNVSSADTDHFDDAVILHEIGHHIENVCGRMDSPGGQHFAQFRIDPRLAWSEGWGNFLGAHLLKNNLAKINPNLPGALPNGEWLHYNDTRGYIDGTTPTFNGSMILMRLNKNGNGTGLGSTFDAVSPASFPGESHVREGSIARGLFKATNTCTTNCTGGVGFEKYWEALSRTTEGMGNDNNRFTSSAKFFAKVFAANGNSFPAAVNTMMTSDEALHMIGHSAYSVSATSTSMGSITTNAWPGFGIKLVPNLSCTANLLQARSTLYTYATQSDQRYSNHFYSIRKADLPGVTSIRLVPDSSCAVDLDLVVFNENYSYNEDCTQYTEPENSAPFCSSVVKTTSDSVATLSRGSTNSEVINLSSLGTGFYLLNVRGYSPSPTTIPSDTSCVYRLTDQNGSLLCPSSSY